MSDTDTSITLPNGWSPRPYQEPVFEYFRNGGRRAYLNWHRRCIAAGTYITLDSGYAVPIETLQVGDKVLSWVDGEYTTDTVTAVWPAGRKEVNSVKASGFPELLATGDHRILTHQNGRNYKWVEAQHIPPTRQAVIYNECRQAYSQPHTPFSNAALLGYLISDGSTTEGQSPKFTNNDEGVLTYVESLIPHTVRTPKGNGFDIRFPNGTRGGGETPNPVKEMCRVWGILCRKEDKRVPRALFSASLADKVVFLGAVFDSDASIYMHPPKTAFGKPLAACGDIIIHVGLGKALAHGYYWLLRSIGIHATVGLSKTCYFVRIQSMENVRKFLLLVPVHHSKKTAVRDSILALPTVKPRRLVNGAYSAGLKVTPVGSAETWDIETEKHARFFANGYLVHNSGKDDLALHFTACQAAQRPGNYWHMLPQYGQCRKAIWEAVNPRTGIRRIDEAFPMAMRETTRTQDMMIKFINGATWQLVGSDNFDSLVGSPPVGLVFSEYALADPRSWAYLRPILADNDGWAMMITTPRGKNHAYTLYNYAKDDDNWYTSTVTAKDSGLFSEEALTREKAELVAEFGVDEGEAIFRQEYFCDFHGATAGSYFGSHMQLAEAEGRITSVPYDANLPVSTGWDIGVGDAMSIVFAQKVGLETRIIDYYEAQGESVQHAVKILQSKPYTYDQHVMPHDISVRVWSDSANTRYETALALGIKPITLVPRVKAVDERIHILRTAFPTLLFDKKKCGVLIEHLRSYKKKWNDILKMWEDKPVHDSSSNGVDAIGCYLTGVRPVKPVKTVQQIMANMNIRGTW